MIQLELEFQKMTLHEALMALDDLLEESFGFGKVGDYRVVSIYLGTIAGVGSRVNTVKDGVATVEIGAGVPIGQYPAALTLAFARMALSQGRTSMTLDNLMEKWIILLEKRLSNKDIVKSIEVVRNASE